VDSSGQAPYRPDDFRQRQPPEVEDPEQFVHPRMTESLDPLDDFLQTADQGQAALLDS